MWRTIKDQRTIAKADVVPGGSKWWQVIQVETKAWHVPAAFQQFGIRPSHFVPVWICALTCAVGGSQIRGRSFFLGRVDVQFA